MQSSVFPAFITDTYRPGNGFASFEQQAQATAERTRRTFETSFSEIQSIASRALTMPRNSGGSLDLGVSQYREAAAAANAQAIALREIAAAADRAARANGDLSEETRRYVQAARSAAIEQEVVATSANQEAVAMERLQAELNQTSSRTQMMIGANRNLANSQGQLGTSARAARFGYIQLNQQLQDTAIQAQAGVSPLTILVQQGTQASYALSQMGGVAGRVGMFFAGGWGSAIFIGVAAVGYLIQALTQTEDAAHAATTAASALGEAQGALGQMFDLATGKIEHNTEVLRLNAIQTALNLRIQGQRQILDSQRDLRHSVSGSVETEGLPEFGVEASPVSRAIRDILVRNRISGTGNIDPAAAERAMLALANLETSARAQRYSERVIASITAAREAVNNQFQGRAAIDIGDRTLSSIDRGVVDPSLRRDARTRRPREDHRPDQAASSIEQITRINEAWDAQPALVDRAVEAVRNLDRILAEAQAHKLPRFAEMAADAQVAERSIREGLIRQIASGFDEAPKLIQRAATAMEQLNAAAQHFPEMAPQITAAGAAIQNALLKPYRDVLENLVQQADQQRLISEGRDGEAQALTVIRQLEDQLGDIGEARRQTIIAGTVALREQARQLQIVQDRQQSYLRAVGSVRTSVEGLFANPGNPGDFFSGLTRAFSQLNAEELTERLFGGIFRKMEDHATGRDRVREENVNYATAIAAMRTEIGTLREAEQQHRQSLDQVIGSLGNFRGALDTTAAAVRGQGGGAGAATNLANWRNGGSGPAGLDGSAPTGRLPVSGTITNTYAQHLARGSHGLDIAAALGTPVAAPASGQVLIVGEDARSGIFVKLDNGGGVTSSFSHLSRTSVTQGQMVSAGDILGLVGQTGHATGPHLHYRVKVNGQDVDPQTYQFTQQVAASRAAVAQLGSGLTDLNSVLAGLTDSVAPAAQAITSASRAVDDAKDIIVTGPHRGQGGRAANDNGTIVDATTNLNPRQFARTMAIEMSQRVFGSEFGTQAGNALANALQGAIFGDQVGSILHAGGINLPNGLAQGLGALAGQIPGFGNAVQGISSAMPFIGAAVSVNHAIGNLLGNNQIKNGGLLNLIIGPFLTALFGSAKRGSATITSVDGTPTTRGNDSSRISTASSLATGVQAAIQHIADALGGTIGSFSGSIGVRKDKYVVDPTGRGRTKGSGTLSFTNEADAVAALLHDAIMDGAVQGLRAGSLALLQHAKDIDTGIAKALKFEGVFTDLKARLDPVGAALDTLNKKFADLKTIFAEAGASAEDYAKLEQEYGLERADAVKQAGEQMTSALKSLLDDLTTNNSALSLRDRLASAHAAYDPLAARVAAGDTTVNYDDFAAAARTLLDIERQIDGSTSAYFDLLAQVTDLTKSALDRQNALIDAASSADTPFTAAVSAGADQTVSALDKLGNLLVDQLGGQLSAVNDNMATMIGLLAAQSGGGGGGGAFSNIANF